MHRYFFRAVLFLLASTQALVSYEGSSASQLASIEPEPSALICGCVHAVTGDFLFQKPDMIVKGAQAIAIPRKYYSSCHEASIEDQMLPHRKAFGWGIPDFIHITRLSIPEPSGMVFTYIQRQKRAYRPLKGGFQAGITGYLFDYLGNRYHPANNRAYWPNDTTLLVYTSTGEVRVYEKTKFANSQPECQFEFRLSRLRLSNGAFIDYEYKKDRLKTITALSAAKKGKTFSKAKFSEKTDRLLIKGSDKSTLEYGYKAYKRKFRGQKHKVKLLKYVASSLYPSEKLKREKKSIRIQERHFDHGRSLSCEYHKSGQAAKLTGPQGTLATIAYENGETTSLDRDGNKTTYHYNPKTLRIDKIHYYQGANTPLKTETYTWNIFGCLEQKTIASGDGEILLAIQCKYNNHLDLIEKRATSGQEYAIYYDYNDRFLLSEEREDSGNKTTYTYLQNANLPEEICTYKNDRLLKRMRYLYNEDLLLVEETIDSPDHGYRYTKTIKRKQEKPLYGMPEEISKYCNERLIEKTTLLYDELGNVTKQKHYGSDGKLQTTSQTTYNEKSQIIKEIDPEGHTTEHRYDDNGNLIWEKTPLGLEIHSTYDTANRLIEERQTGSGQTLITRYQDFDALDHPTKIIDPLGSMTHRKYNALGHLIQETNPEGHTTAYTHDALGNVLSITDPLGNTTTITYNSYSQPLCITHPDRSQETHSYNPDGTKASYTNETGITTHYTYDIFNNLSSEEIANGPKKTWTYDAFHLLEETNLDGYTTTYAYDDLGRKSQETYEGRTTYYTYDPLSRVISEQTGNVRTEWTYNKQSHITSETIYDDNHLTYQTKTTYNHDGSPLEVTTYPNNQPAITKTTYDTFGRQTSHTTLLGHQTKTTYQITDGTKTITTHEMGGITQTATYNTLDQLLTQERTDTSGKLLSKTDYTYDPSGNLIKQTTDTHTIEWTYDSRHRKITETESDQKTTHYTYYLDSTLQTLTKPDGTTLSYTYNKLGHLRNLHSSKGDIHYTYTYNNQGHLLLSKDLIHQTQTKRIVDPHGHILEETLANGLHLKSRYDELGRKTQLTLPDKTITYTHTGTNLASVTIDDKTHSYTYDQSNNLIQEKHIDGSTTEYTYDLNSRLIKSKHPHLEEILQYDQRGNLVKITRNKEQLLYTYDPLDHLTCEPRHTYLYDPLHNPIQKDNKTIAYNHLNQETQLKYDPNGNLLAKGSYSLEYDSLGRLIKAKTWFTTTTYTYDSEHRRISENSTPILWDGQHEMGSPNLYRILGRTPFAEIGSAVAIYDQSKLVQPLHTATGDIFQIQDHTPQTFTAFGEGKASTRWGYRSKVHDSTGLIYFGRRYYDPETSRFITPDPEGYLDGPNLYQYCLNNPLAHHDPYGLYTNALFDPNTWKEVGTAVYHGSLSYARDTALFAGTYFGGYHGPDDMSFADIYSAHQDANDRFIKKTDNWMASSPYAGSDEYNWLRGKTYTEIDTAANWMLPLGKVKAIGNAGKVLLKAGKIAHRSPTLLKTTQVFGKLFKSNRSSVSQRASLVAGKSKISKLSPHSKAIGPHSSFKYCPQTGKVSGYETYDYNPIQGVWSAKIRFRGAGKCHGRIEPPLVLERRPGKGAGSTPIVPRKPMSWELPYGYEL